MLQLRANPGSVSPRIPSLALHSAFESALPAYRWSLAPRSVFVGLFELRDWRPWVGDAYAMIDALECQRVARRRSEDQRDQLALAYALHRLLLSQALGCEPAKVPIGRDAAGCPRLRGTGLGTSLSHAAGVLALAVSAEGPVGVDIESAARVSAMPEIAERVVHPDDEAELAPLTAAARNAALLALWVRKEAFLKAAGIGLQREMQTFAALDDSILALPGGETSRVRMLDVGPHWVAAVAGPPGSSIDCDWLRPARMAAARRF